MIPAYMFLTLSTLLFFIGVLGFVTRRNLIAMLISVELVLNSVDINFAVVRWLFLYPLFYGNKCCRDSSSYCNNYKCIP